MSANLALICYGFSAFIRTQARSYTDGVHDRFNDMMGACNH